MTNTKPAAVQQIESWHCEHSHDVGSILLYICSSSKKTTTAALQLHAKPLEYCLSDVLLLHEGVRKFRRRFLVQFSTACFRMSLAWLKIDLLFGELYCQMRLITAETWKRSIDGPVS